MLNLLSARVAAGVGAFALACCSNTASAHAVLAQPKAEAGTFYKAAIGVTHGCKGLPTREVIITIPAGVQGAKPMPKAGWTVEITRGKLAQPRSSHGRTITEDVTQIRFSGGALPNDHYDEFTLVATLPSKAGVLWWQVSQVCEQGRHDWNQIPAAGQDPHQLESPALRLEVTPGAHAGHRH